MTASKVEHIEDFTAHEWCSQLLSDPSITHISKRHVSEKRDGVSNTFFTRTLFTDDAVRAFLSLYRPGKGQTRSADEDHIFTGSALVYEELAPSNVSQEAQRQAAKEEKAYDVNDPDAPEAIILASLGNDVDGGLRRLHGGVTAALLDQVMGSLISHFYEIFTATAELNIKYKKAVTTPCVLICRAKLYKEKGRWIEMMGWVEDGTGTVFAEGRGAFVLERVATAKV